MAIAFDTLDYAQKLEATGVPRAQAEGQTRALSEVLGHFLDLRQELTSTQCRALVRCESVKLEMPVRLESLPGRRKFVDLVLMVLLAVDVVLSMAYVLGR